MPNLHAEKVPLVRVGGHSWNVAATSESGTQIPTRDPAKTKPPTRAEKYRTYISLGPMFPKYICMYVFADILCTTQTP